MMTAPQKWYKNWEYFCYPTHIWLNWEWGQLRFAKQQKGRLQAFYWRNSWRKPSYILIQLIKPRILTGMYTEHSSLLRSEVNLNRGDISTWAEEEKYLNRLLLQNTHCWNSMNANFRSKAVVLFIIVKVHHISNLLHSATIFKSSIMYYVSPKKSTRKKF